EVRRTGPRRVGHRLPRLGRRPLHQRHGDPRRRRRAVLSAAGPWPWTHAQRLRPWPARSWLGPLSVSVARPRPWPARSLLGPVSESVTPERSPPCPARSLLGPVSASVVPP